MSPETASLIGAGISAAAAIGVAVVGLYGARSHRHTRDQLAVNTTKTDAVLHQVRNDHGTNLRDDLDQLAERVAESILGQAGLEAGLARVASMLGQVQRLARDTQRAQESHDAASVVLVNELHKADRALWAEIAKHHPSE